MTKRFIETLANQMGFNLSPYDGNVKKYNDLFHKYQDFTMVPKELFVENLRICNKHNHLVGDYVECGVWKGGMSAAISESLGPERRVHLFDSFEGLPQAKEIDGQRAIAWQKNIRSEGYYDNCTADESFSRTAMGLANHQKYRIYKGWFEDTLTAIDSKAIAILRLDGDWYDSIKVCLNKLFPLLIDGGIVILDDYYSWDGCTRAVHDFLSETKSSSRICQWNNKIAYIIKST